jgi:hypothetical protein
MRSLPLLAAAVILTGFAYWFLRPSEIPPEPPAESTASIAHPETPPPPVPFLIKAKVRAIHEQLAVISRSTSRGDIGPAQVKIGLAVEDIKERLQSDGIRDEASMLSAVRAAAAAAGFSEVESDEIAAAFQAGGPAKQSAGLGRGGY